MKDVFFQNFAEQVFNLDPHIRFVGMASQEGKLLGYRYHHGTQNQMTEMDLEKSMVPLIIQIQLYNRVREIAGELRYHIGTFERLYAASIPVRLDPKAEIYILMSFELGCKPDQIIEDGLLPLIHRDRDYFK
ncbi:MAG TPA: hypothetical protein VI338_05905 [Nitrososphaera sp.]|nr:hypothetical protein [Nitrososphaera sp.]